MNAPISTTILDELDLPDGVRAVLNRESLRTGVPVGVLVKDWLVEVSERLVSAAGDPPPRPHRRHHHRATKAAA